MKEINPWSVIALIQLMCRCIKIIQHRLVVEIIKKLCIALDGFNRNSIVYGSSGLRDIQSYEVAAIRPGVAGCSDLEDRFERFCVTPDLHLS